MRKTVARLALFIVNLPYVWLMAEVYTIFAALGRSDVPWYILGAGASVIFRCPISRKARCTVTYSRCGLMRDTCVASPESVFGVGLFWHTLPLHP